MPLSQSRRDFLLNSLSVGCCAGILPFAPTISFAATPTENRLVVILLRGAMDGMDVVRPIGDPLFHDYRPSVAGDESLELDDFYGLHPSLRGLWDLWKQGELAIGQAVSTPYRDKRSHFDGQMLLEAGVREGLFNSDNRSGWLNRALQLMPDSQPKTAFGVGLDHFRILEGEADYSKWYPGRRITLTPSAQSLLEKISDKDPLFSSTLAKAVDLSGDENKSGHSSPMMMFGGQNGGTLDKRMIDRAEGIAKFVAAKLVAETRIATFSLDGWDTHIGQKAKITRSLGALQQAITTLKSNVTENVWDHTTVLCVTEFGRTVRENGARGVTGTDHGTGGIVITAGGAIKGQKVYGKWPGLNSADLYRDRDLRPTTDVRNYMAEALTLFGLTETQLTRDVFPDMKAIERSGFI